MAKRWLEKDIFYLTENYSKKGLEEMSMHLNRSVNTIYQRAIALGLERESSWTKDEDVQLKKLFPKTDNEAIALILKNKTVSAIRNRATKLKLKKSKHYWKVGQEKYVLENYGKLPIDVMVSFLKKTRWAIINKHRELNGESESGGRKIISKIKK